jgi:predicted transcriptional regulator
VATNQLLKGLLVVRLGRPYQLTVMGSLLLLAMTPLDLLLRGGQGQWL